MILVGSVLLSGLVGALIFKIYKASHQDVKQFFLPALAFKLLAGVCLGLIYTFYYTVGDTFGFFDDAQQLVRLFQNDLGGYINFIWSGDASSELGSTLINVQFRSLFLVKILSVVLLGSFNNYWMASLYFSLSSFLGSWYLLTKIQFYFSKGTGAAVISFLFIPSFIFWSSGIIKESLAIGALMFLAGCYVQIINKASARWWEWLTALVSIIVLWNLKYYWAALFIPSAITSIVVVRIILKWIPKLNRISETITWITLFCCIVLAASTIHPNFYLSRFLMVVVENNNAYTMVSDHGPSVHFYDLQATWSSILLNSPWALFSGLFRPFLFESQTLFQLIISIENLLLLLLCVYNFKYLKAAMNSSHRHLILSAAIYIILLAAFLTLSTPNFGTLSRYRVGFLPFFFFLLLYHPCQPLFEKVFKLK